MKQACTVSVKEACGSGRDMDRNDVNVNILLDEFSV